MSNDDRQIPLLGAGGSIQEGSGITGDGHTAVGATTCGYPRNLANVLTMAVAYLCLFTAFQTTQILAAALLGNLGTIAIGVLYLCFVASGFFAPVIARKLGPVRGLVFGGCTYVLFMLSFIYMVAPVVLLCACIIGCGASILWCSQGMMLTQCTNDTNKATYSSLFWGIFNLCVIPGNVVGHFLLMEKKPKPSDSTASTVAHVAAMVGLPVPIDDSYGSLDWSSTFMLQEYDLDDHAGSASHAGTSKWSFPMVIGWNDEKSPLFIFLAASGILGTCLFFCIKTPDSSQGSKVEPLDSRPVSEQIFATIRLMFKARMVCLLPLFLFSGIEMTMWSAWFTRQMYKTEIGLVMVGFGLSEFVAGFFFGKISDKYGRWALLIPGSACMTVAMYLTWIANKATMATCAKVPCDDGVAGDIGCPCQDADYTKYYYAAVLYGLTDCAFQTAASAVCAQDFVASGLAADAFALYRTFQSLGGVIGFGLSPMLSVHGGTTSDPDQLQTELTITAAVGIAALVGLMVYSATPDTARTPISTKHAPQPVGDNYSQAVSAGGFLYLAGQIGLRPNQSAEEFKASGLSIEAQTEIACYNIKAVLKAGGCKPADLVKVTVFLADIGDFGNMNEVYKKHFVEAGFVPPARSAFAVAALPLGALVEIEAVAAIP